MRQFTIAV